MSGFCAWRRRPLPARAVRHAVLLELISEIYLAPRRTYGARRVHVAGHPRFVAREANDRIIDHKARQHPTATPSEPLDSTYRGINAVVVESFWARMQVELLNRRRWRTRLELSNAIFEYLEIFHNRQRRHSSLGMLTPVEYELRHATTAVRDQAS